MSAMDNNDNINELSHDCQSPVPSNSMDCNWSMFEPVKELGGGAFGKVYKVKCLVSTKICDSGGERVKMRTQSVKQTKAAVLKQRVQTTFGSNKSNIEGRFLLQDEHYVIKVIDVAEVPEKVGLEALNEIEIMGSLDSPYIVGYIDSFIDDQKIHIVLEYCAHGDLNSLVEKQKAQGTGTVVKPFVDNLIWKIFINICLGVQYLHNRNIIHRDLKSLNIFMVKENYAKIGDLGCFKYYDPPKEPIVNEDEKKMGNDTRRDTETDTKSESKPSQVEPQETGNMNQEDMLFQQAPFEKEDNILADLSDDELMFKELDQGQQDAFLIDDLALAAKDSAQFDQATKNAPTPGDSNADQIQEKKTPEEELEVSRVGTPFYLAPELWKNPKYSPASDIWALGVILYEICCLSYPFPATEMDELERKVLNEKIAKYPNFVSQDFVTLFKKMLDKNPLRRPCIETIIFSDIFQQKAQQNHITLPLFLNKQKLQNKFSLSQLAGVELTEKQKRLAGILYPAKPTKVKAEPRPSARQSILNQNLNNKKADSPEKRPTTAQKQGGTNAAASHDNRVLYKSNAQMSKRESNNVSRSQMTDRGGEDGNKKDKHINTDAKTRERNSMVSQGAASAHHRKQKGGDGGTADREAEKETPGHQASAKGSQGTSRFQHSRQSIAVSQSSKNKLEDSPQKKEQPTRFTVAKKPGMGLKSPGQFDTNQRDSESLILDQHPLTNRTSTQLGMAKDSLMSFDALDDTVASSKEKGGTKFKPSSRHVITEVDPVVVPVPASVKNSTSKKGFGSHKFGGLDRAQSSMKDDSRIKQGSDSQGPSRFQLNKESQAHSSANKQQQQSTRFGIRSSQELHRDASLEDRKRHSQANAISNFQLHARTGTQTAQAFRDTENKLVAESEGAATEDTAGAAEKGKLSVPFKQRRLKHQTLAGSSSLNASQQDLSLKSAPQQQATASAKGRASTSSGANKLEEVLVHHVDSHSQMQIAEKDEEHVRSLAEIMFADNIKDEEKEKQNVSVMQKAQSDQVGIRGSNIFKESAGSGKKKSTPLSIRPSEGKASNEAPDENRGADNQQKAAVQSNLKGSQLRGPAYSVASKNPTSRPGSRLAAPSASVSQQSSLGGAQQKYKLQKLESIAEKPTGGVKSGGAAEAESLSSSVKQQDYQTQRSVQSSELRGSTRIQPASAIGQNTARTENRAHAGQQLGAGGLNKRNSNPNSSVQGIKEPSQQTASKLGLQRKPTQTSLQSKQGAQKKPGPVSATSNKATDRASIASSEKGTLKGAPGKGTGVPARRKNPETSQSFTHSANKLANESAKDKSANATGNKRANPEKRPTTKLGGLKELSLGDFRGGASTSRTGQLTKRHTEQDAAKFFHPSTESVTSQNQSKQGGIPTTSGMKRNTTLQKIVTGPIIQTPDAPGNSRPNTKGEKSINSQKMPANLTGATGPLDKRRETIGSPYMSLNKKQSDSKSSSCKMSVPGSINNSSNQQPATKMQWQSDHKLNNPNNFGKPKQSNNNTSKKADSPGIKKGELDSEQPNNDSSINKQNAVEPEFEGSSLQISRTESSPKPQLNSSMDNEDTLRRKDQQVPDSAGNSSSQGQGIKQPFMARKFADKDKLRREQQYRTVQASTAQKPGDQGQTVDTALVLEKAAASDPHKLKEVEDEPQESDTPFEPAQIDKSSNHSNHDLDSSLNNSQLNNSQMLLASRRPTATRKFVTKHSNYVSSSVNKSLHDLRLGDTSLNQSKDGLPIDSSFANYNTKPADRSFQDRLRGNSSNSQMQLPHMQINDAQNTIGGSNEAVLAPPKGSSSPRAGAGEEMLQRRPSTLVRFRQRIDEKRRLNSATEAGQPRKLQEEAEDPQDAPQERNAGGDATYVFKDELGNQHTAQYGQSSGEQQEQSYAEVQVQQMSADEQLHQGGQGVLQAKKQNNHSIIKEMVEEENDQK